MLPPEAGIPLIRRELTAGAKRGEIVVGQRLGVLLDEWDSTSGLDTSETPPALTSSTATGPVVGKIASMSLFDGYSIEASLDPSVQPFLYDHKIDGTPVLPGVMGIEAFAEAALSLLPDWHVEAIEDVRFLAPFKFYRNEPRVLRIETRIYPSGDKLLADCCLIGHRPLPNQTEPQATLHFTARVRLATELAPRPAPYEFVKLDGNIIEAADVYKVYFHGPAYQVIEKAWWNERQIIGQMPDNLPPNHHPSGLATIMSPRLIELCFQTAGLWELGVNGRMGLPHRVREVCLFSAPDPAQGGLYAVVTPHPTQESFDALVLDKNGNCYLRLAGYQTIGLPGAVDAKRLEQLQTVISGEALLAV
jgi:hypothetical protein